MNLSYRLIMAMIDRTTNRATDFYLLVFDPCFVNWKNTNDFYDTDYDFLMIPIIVIYVYICMYMYIYKPNVFCFKTTFR